MFAPNDYLLAGILFLALLFVVIDLWSFKDSTDFAKKRLSHYISIYLYIYLSVTKAIAGLQIRALLKLLGCLYNNCFDCMNFETVIILFAMKFYSKMLV